MATKEGPEILAETSDGVYRLVRLPDGKIDLQVKWHGRPHSTMALTRDYHRWLLDLAAKGAEASGAPVSEGPKPGLPKPPVVKKKRRKKKAKKKKRKVTKLSAVDAAVNLRKGPI